MQTSQIRTFPKREWWSFFDAVLGGSVLVSVELHFLSLLGLLGLLVLLLAVVLSTSIPVF
jgi:hypothetical protein